MKIGIIGTGSIGATAIRKLAAAGHEVLFANSRGPHTLGELAAETGATATDAAGAVTGVDAIILSIPLAAMPGLRDLLVDVPDDVPVIDTSNYYPSRDGQIPELDAGQVEGLWVTEHLGRPIVKAWNAVLHGSFAERGRPVGAADRITLPVSGDDPEAKRVAMELVSATGFDAYDAGSLAESWRIQPGNPAFCADLDAAELELALSLADRDRAARRRDLGIEAIGALGEATNEDVLHLYRAMTKSPGRNAD